MQSNNKFTSGLEKLFWLFLFINPLLDILNGFYINSIMNVNVLDIEFIASLGITPTLVIRMIFLLVFAVYILLVRDWYAVMTAVPIGLAWVLSLLGELKFTGSLDFFVDAQYMARFCYNIAILMVYSHVFSKRWGYDGKDLLASLNTVSVYTVIVLSVAVLVPAIFGMGYSTYADPMGYRGNRGFFYAGNDITAILALLLPIVISAEMNSAKQNAQMSGKTKLAVFPAVAAGFGSCALLVIGSKTAFIAVFASYTVLFICSLGSRWKEHSFLQLKGWIFSLLAAVAAFLLINVISIIQQTYEQGFGIGSLFQYSILKSVLESFNMTSIIMEKDGLKSALMSGRQIKLAEQFGAYTSGGFYNLLFGIGRGSQETIIEMDLCEVLCYYGIFGVAAMLWIYAKLGINFLLSFFRRINTVSVSLLLSLGMTVGYLAMAGHILFSVTSGFYLSFIILYSRVFFADTKEKINIWKNS